MLLYSIALRTFCFHSQ